MSLRMLFDEPTYKGMLETWPTKPAVYNVPDDSRFPDIVNAQLLKVYLDTGTAPAEEINVIKGGQVRHPKGFTTPAGRLDPAKIAMWRDRGWSFQLRNINNWFPPLYAMCAGIQRETGYGCYVTGFVTPGGGQGLDYHWDQNMGVVCQLNGRKTWQIWEPVVEEPHRNYLASNRQPLGELVERLKASGPDQEVELGPGQILVLPRGWIHNPRAADGGPSTHLTFVIRERTGFWITKRLAAAAIESTPLRRVIAPARVVDPATLSEEVGRARAELIDWLENADAKALAGELLTLACSELEVDYV